MKHRKSHTPSTTESSYSTGDDLEISRKHKDPNSTRIQRQDLRPNKHSFGIQSLADFGNELAATSHAPSARTSSGSSNSFRRASHSCFQGPPPDASVKKLGVPPGSPWHTFPSFSIIFHQSIHFPPKKSSVHITEATSLLHGEKNFQKTFQAFHSRQPLRHSGKRQWRPRAQAAQVDKAPNARQLGARLIQQRFPSAKDVVSG